jgi:Zn-dependent protease
MSASPPNSDSRRAAEPPTATVKGSFRLFRLLGTDVFLHWSWFVVAYFRIQGREVPYSSLVWDITEYSAGFLIVLLHEFGHVLACRQTGGVADRVVLWPLGGLAFVAPPARPGANLWTTAAGPLVNVVLTPILIGLAVVTAPGDPPLTDLHRLCFALAFFNVAILIFNLLPIYPLDGGRILQALLWWWLGRATALKVVSILGLVAASGLALLAAWVGDWWLVLMTVFLALGAFGGLSQAKLLGRIADAPLRTNVACPGCGSSPPKGAFWQCVRCREWFDLFDWSGPITCPKGGNHALRQTCLECGRQVQSPEWVPVARGGEDEPGYATRLLRSELKTAFSLETDDPQAQHKFFDQTAHELRGKQRTADVAFGLFLCDVGLACGGEVRPAAEAYALFPLISSNATARSLICWLTELFPFPQDWNPHHDAQSISAWILEHEDHLSWSEAEGSFALRDHG